MSSEQLYKAIEQNIRKRAESDPNVKAFVDARDVFRADGLDALKRAGFFITAESSDNIIKIVSDRIEILYENDTGRIILDGKDITELIQRVSISLTPNAYPQITIMLREVGIRINASDVHEKK